MKIKSNGIAIHVEQSGRGELALVFLHYYGGSSRTWDAVAKQLADKYRIVATDHRGWGQSEAPSDGYGIADMAADAQGVIDALALERYVLIGHSMGGKVAQLIASHRPAGLAGLVLVAPSPPTPMLLSDAERATLAGAYQTRESVEFVIDNVLTAKPLDVAQRGQVIENSLKGAPQAKAGWPNLALPEDISSEVTAIVTPTIVISGELDRVDRIETLQAELLPRIPHASLHILPETGHLSPLESPVEVASIIGRFADALRNNAVVCLKPEEVPEAFDAAMNAGDLDALMSIFSNVATMRMTDGDVVQGHVALRAALERLLSSGPRITNTVRSVLISGDVALLLLDWTIHWVSHDGKQHEQSGTATNIVAKGLDEGWRLRVANPLGVI